MHLVSSWMCTFAPAAHVAALQNCRQRKQPVALNASKASLLLMTNWGTRWWICWWAFGHLGRRSVAWPGFGGCLQPPAPTPPHHHTASQSPTPRPPSWTKSPKWRPSLLLASCLERRKQRKQKFWAADHLIESWICISTFKMSELAEWEILSWQTFDTFLVCWFSFFWTPSHPCTIGTTTLDLKFISGRQPQHAEGLEKEEFRFSFGMKEKNESA